MTKKKTNYIVLFVAIVLVLYFTLKDDFSNIIEQLKNVNIFIYIIAFSVFMLSLLFKSISLKIFTNEYKDYSLKKTFNLNLISLFLNGITPFQTGGQPFQIYLMKKDGFRISDATNAMIGDCIAYQTALIIIGFIALIINLSFNIFSIDHSMSLLVLLGFVINVIVLIMLIIVTSAKQTGFKLLNKFIDFLFKFKFMKKFDNKKEEMKKSLKHFYDTGRKIKKNKFNLLIGILCNIINLSLLYIVPLFIFMSLKSNDINVIESFVSTAFVMLIGNIIPIPGATGGIEYSFMRFFGKFIKNPTLSSGMLLWRFATYFLGLIIGSIALILKRGDKKKCV